MKLRLSILLTLALPAPATSINVLKGAFKGKGGKTEQAPPPSLRSMKKCPDDDYWGWWYAQYDDDCFGSGGSSTRTDDGDSECCTNEDSTYGVAVDTCQHTSDCSEGWICKLVGSANGATYKTCSDGNNYSGFPRVCDVDEEECGDDDVPITDDPTTRTDDTDSSNDDGLNVGDDFTDPSPTPAPTAARTDCARAGVSNYVKTTVAGWQEGIIQGLDECISNAPGSQGCPGFCKAYNWNVCDFSGAYDNAPGVMLLCAP